MPFESKNRETDKNVGNKVQSSSNVDFTRQSIRRKLEEAKESPSTSKDTKIDSLKALLERNGSTAPGSEIPLTGKGLLGGGGGETSQSCSELAKQQKKELAKQQKKELKNLEKTQREEIVAWLNRPNEGNDDPDGARFRALRNNHMKQLMDMQAKHEIEMKQIQ